MAGLVDEDEDPEDDKEDTDGEERIHPRAVVAEARVRVSAARTVSRSRAGLSGWPSSTRSMTSAIRPKVMRPSRKAATATSLAALKAAGKVPPRRAAAIPSPKARKAS